MSSNQNLAFCEHDMLLISCARCQSETNPEAKELYDKNIKTFKPRTRKIHPKALQSTSA